MTSVYLFNKGNNTRRAIPVDTPPEKLPHWLRIPVWMTGEQAPLWEETPADEEVATMMLMEVYTQSARQRNLYILQAIVDPHSKDLTQFLPIIRKAYGV